MAYLDEDVLYDNIEEKYKIAIGEARKAYSDVLDTICEMPRADVAKVEHGYWKQKYEKAPRYVCSLCNHLFNNKEYNYCPKCGAKMDGKQQKEG